MIAQMRPTVTGSDAVPTSRLRVPDACGTVRRKSGSAPAIGGLAVSGVLQAAVAMGVGRVASGGVARTAIVG